MRWTTVAVVLLLAVFAAELLLSVRQETQTFDESAHMFAPVCSEYMVPRRVRLWWPAIALHP